MTTGKINPPIRKVGIEIQDAPRFFDFERLAIHWMDIWEFNLPPLRIKRDEQGNFTDSRAPKFHAQYGDQCVELDALPPEELRRRVREAIESHMDPAAWDRAIAVEKAELGSIEDIVSKWQPQS